jgi:hypothetical protein
MSCAVAGVDSRSRPTGHYPRSGGTTPRPSSRSASRARPPGQRRPPRSARTPSVPARAGGARLTTAGSPIGAVLRPPVPFRMQEPANFRGACLVEKRLSIGCGRGYGRRRPIGARKHKNLRPDLALLDPEMPGGTGSRSHGQFAPIRSSRRPGGPIRTGCTAPVANPAGWAGGADYSLTKSCSPRQCSRHRLHMGGTDRRHAAHERP